MSKGEQLIDLVYVDDVVNAYLIAANRVLNNELENHEIYAVSSEERLGLKDLITLYLQITKIDVQIEWGARPYRIREVMIPWWNGKKLPGWTPKVSLLDGIQKIAKEQNLGNK
jgi:nucleoside-diphosphate-sugar epimerase